jgi:hypothetical protein
MIKFKLNPELMNLLVKSLSQIMFYNLDIEVFYSTL